MRKTLKIAGGLIAIVIVAALARAAYLLVDFNMFRSTERQFAGQCVSLGGIAGPEDVGIDYETGTAYISATNRGGSSEAGRDGIYRLDLAGAPDANAQLLYLPLEGLSDFHPHGIDVLRLDDGTLRIFVVNHAGGAHSVELIDVREDRLVHVQTIRDPLIMAPNDVAAIGPRSFYVTNDEAKEPRPDETIWDMLWDIYWGITPTTAVFWDGETAHVAADNLARANGIDTSTDGSEVYINEVLGKSTRIYAREQSNELRLKETVAIGGAPDNVAAGPDGRVLVGVQPRVFEIIVAFIEHRTGPAASQVMEIIRDGDTARAEEIYMDPGKEISFLTSATPFDTNKFIMGSAFDDVVVCERSPEN
jgi:arylesterase/paraoxonase